MTKLEKQQRRDAARARREGAMQPGPAAQARTARSFRRWVTFMEARDRAPRRPDPSPVRVPRFAHADWLKKRLQRDRRRNGVPA